MAPRVDPPQGRLPVPRLPAGLGFVELPEEAASGFIWSVWTPDSRPILDAETRALLAEIEGLGHERTRSRAIRRSGRRTEAPRRGGLELYHFKIAHRQTVGPLFGDTTSHYERFGASFRLSFHERRCRP